MSKGFQTPAQKAAKRPSMAQVDRLVKARLDEYHRAVMVPMSQAIVDGFTQVLVENGVIEESPEGEMDLEHDEPQERAKILNAAGEEV